MQPYGGDFPILSIQDLVKAQFLLLDHLKIKKVGILNNYVFAFRHFFGCDSQF